MIDLATITAHLDSRRAGFLLTAVRNLETAVAAGVVPNAQFNDAKDTISRAVEQGVEHFLNNTGPQDAERPHLKALWHGAYHADALVSGQHGIPAALKRVRKVEALAPYAAFLDALLPLNLLLQTAKPLIAKKGDKRLPPPPKSAEQIEREARSMTCQCCGRAILANLGSIAHHGYERPGHGWQTGSCIGAKELPFEVSRDALGAMIQRWKEHRKELRDQLSRVTLEVVGINLQFPDTTKPRNRLGDHPVLHVEATRANFDKHMTEKLFAARFNRCTFDELLARDIASRKSNIDNLSNAIVQQQARYGGWKQTHSGFENGAWVAL